MRKILERVVPEQGAVLPEAAVLRLPGAAAREAAVLPERVLLPGAQERAAAIIEKALRQVEDAEDISAETGVARIL